MERGAAETKGPAPAAEESQGPASTAAEVPEGPASGAAEDGLAAAPLGGLALLESRLDAIAQLLAGHLEAEERRQLRVKHAQLTEQLSSLREALEREAAPADERLAQRAGTAVGASWGARQRAP